MNKLVKISAILASIAFFSNASFAAEHVAADKSATMGVAVDDMAITTKVKAALAKDDRTSALDTHVETKNGIVILKGTVKSADAAQAAEEVAKSVEGVKSVDAKELVSATTAH